MNFPDWGYDPGGMAESVAAATAAHASRARHGNWQEGHVTDREFIASRGIGDRRQTIAR
jgi:hypothetical protein